MRDEPRLLICAAQFLTRLPLPDAAAFDPRWLARSLRYFPLIGVLIGLIAAGTFGLASTILPAPVAVGLALAATLIVTGALHEDGLADACDGFGGGGSREQVLGIMGDSRIGAFGAAGLLLTLGLKWTSLAALPTGQFFDLVVAAHMWSRWCAIGLIWSLPYARTEPSKVSPFAGQWSALQWLLAGLIGAVGVILAIGVHAGGFEAARLRPLWLPALIALGITILAALYFRRRIGGYTGDCLGAAQQLAELAFFITGLAVARADAVR